MRPLYEREQIKNFLISNDISYMRNKIIALNLKEIFNIDITAREIAQYKHLLGLKSKLKIGYIKRICQNCGKEFFVLNHKLKYEKHIYCSYKCSGEAKSKKALKNNLKDVSEFEIKKFIKEWKSFIKKEIYYNKSFLDAETIMGNFLYYIPSIIHHTKRLGITGLNLKAYIRKSIKYKIWREEDYYKKNLPFSKQAELKYGL